MDSFQDFIEAAEFGKFRKLRKQLKKQGYHPGTFGVEIEFRIPREFDPKDYAHDPYVQKGFQDWFEVPPTIEEWEKKNPAPETPKWNPHDMVANYTAIKGWRLSVSENGKELPEPNFVYPKWWLKHYPDKIKEEQPTDVVSRLRHTGESLIFPRPVEELLTSLRKAWQYGIGYIMRMPENKSEWDDFKRRFRRRISSFENVSEPAFEDKPQANKNLENVAGTLRELTGKMWEKIISFHEDNIHEMQREWLRNETHNWWDEKIQEMMSELDDNWEADRAEAQQERQHWDTGGGKEEALQNWIFVLQQDDKFYEYRRTQKIEYYKNLLKENNIPVQFGNASGTTWGVGVDGPELVEIRTGVLTTNDFPKLRVLLDAVRKNDEITDGGTSAHVHVGMPRGSDMFDALATCVYMDEPSVKQAAGAERDFEQWAKLNDQLYATLWEKLHDGVYNKKQFEDALSGFGKYFGCNISSIVKRRGGVSEYPSTLEFRYLSSEIVRNPEQLFEWINYYLYLPHLGRGRNQIKFQLGTGERQMVINRLPNGNVQVVKGKSSARQHGSPEELRKTSYESPIMRKYRLLQKYGSKMKNPPQLGEPPSPEPEPESEPRPHGWDFAPGF